MPTLTVGSHNIVQYTPSLSVFSVAPVVINPATVQADADSVALVSISPLTVNDGQNETVEQPQITVRPRNILSRIKKSYVSQDRERIRLEID